MKLHGESFFISPATAIDMTLLNITFKATSGWTSVDTVPIVAVWIAPTMTDEGEGCNGNDIWFL